MPEVNEPLHIDLLNDGWVPMKEPKKVSSAILLSVPIIVNAMASSVDILTLLFVLTQIPKNATLRNNGTKTYWKVG